VAGRRLAARCASLGRREAFRAIAKVPSELVLQANLLGSNEMVRERIRAYKNVGVTTLRVAPAGRDLREKLATLGRVMDLARANQRGELSGYLFVGNYSDRNEALCTIPAVILRGARRECSNRSLDQVSKHLSQVGRFIERIPR